jgi:hypothetical protein
MTFWTSRIDVITLTMSISNGVKSDGSLCILYSLKALCTLDRLPDAVS